MSQKTEPNNGYFDNYRGMQPYKKCAECGCSRPPDQLTEAGEYQGKPLFKCTDQRVCTRMKECIDGIK